MKTTLNDVWVDISEPAEAAADHHVVQPPLVGLYMNGIGLCIPNQPSPKDHLTDVDVVDNGSHVNKQIKISESLR
ncbi:hypothetical protein MUBE_10630 [Mycobacterium uberis]|uniref:Uncharacterized protein n=1 Tax=Mycobacterium uberis TaxID=2162698 RepID=A0A3E1HFW8_9MYCO|nr:hypothetical protein MUBE_10630 [Mycobacterium uberis]